MTNAKRINSLQILSTESLHKISASSHHIIIRYPTVNATCSIIIVKYYGTGYAWVIHYQSLAIVLYQYQWSHGCHQKLEKQRKKSCATHHLKNKTKSSKPICYCQFITHTITATLNNKEYMIIFAASPSKTVHKMALYCEYDTVLKSGRSNDADRPLTLCLQHSTKKATIS